MINFNSVTKAFGDDLIALQNITFTIEPGELLVITGPSGSGKTTLMRLLTKEYEPTEGEILFNGQPLSDIRRSKVHQLRRQIGVVFQDYKLLPELNVWENIALPLYIIGQKQTEIEERVSDLLRLISLDDKPFLFPSQLSGGEAQRVSIARALATGPSVIFADEPTGNLDAQTSTSIARLLQKINKLGTTVLIATHDLGVLDLLGKERHIRLERGELVKDEHNHTGTKKRAKPPEVKPEAPHTEGQPQNEVDIAHEEPSTENEAEPEPETKPKRSFWPFGRKQTTAAESTSDSATTEVSSSELDEEVQQIKKSSHKPAKTAQIDDTEAEVKVEKL